MFMLVRRGPETGGLEDVSVRCRGGRRMEAAASVAAGWDGASTRVNTRPSDVSWGSVEAIRRGRLDELSPLLSARMSDRFLVRMGAPPFLVERGLRGLLRAPDMALEMLRLRGRGSAR